MQKTSEKKKRFIVNEEVLCHDLAKNHKIDLIRLLIRKEYYKSL